MRMSPLFRSLGALGAAVLMALSGPARADTLVVDSHGQRLTIDALTDEVLRVRIAPIDAPAEDASWAVAADIRATHAPARVEGRSLSAGAVTATVDPETLGITLTDRAGAVILRSAVTPFVREGTGFTLRQHLDQGEHIFGFGDKTGLLDRRGQSFVNWNTDAWGFQSSSDPIYKSIPFFISSGGAGGAYGVFLDNSWRSWFDFGHRDADVAAFGASAGPVDYYLIAGPAIPDVVRRYAALTGRAPLPPRWVLGYQQSRWSYATEAEVRALATRLRAERIPTDVIWLDIDYQDRNRPFTIDRRAFPHFEQMVGDLRTEGIATVAIVDLHIAHAPNEGYAAYDSGVAGDHFLTNSDGTPYIAPVWPGPSVFPDFTQAETRRWWGGMFAPMTAMGIAGIWNDMNEPAIFETPTKTMPLDVRHRIATDDFAPRVATHAEIHNVYGMENTRATYDGLRTLRPDERAFVMTRASFAGGQRYAATWTGDNSSTWDHLRLAVAQQLSLGLSGFTWSGADVGGFAGGASPELMTRWFQYAAFAPIFRDHAAKDAPRAEPWVDGPEHLAIRRRFVEERYRLMPYFYAAAEAGARTGDPLMRPVFYDYPQMVATPCDAAMTFTLAGRLLIAGAAKPESPTPYDVCLPAGGWYDYWTGAPVSGASSADGRYDKISLTPTMATLPVFVRAGTILPRQPLVQSTQQRPDGPLELHIYPGADCSGTLYDDDGHSMGFARGAFARQSVRCTMDGDTLRSIDFAPREGSFTPWWRTVAITIHGGQRYRATIGGRAVAASNDGRATTLTVPDSAAARRIVLTPAG